MKKRKLSFGERCWIGLAAYILTADIIAMKCEKDTMSISFGSWLESTPGKMASAAAWGLITTHLFWNLPLPGQTKLRCVVTRTNGKSEKAILLLGDCNLEPG